MMRNGKCTIVSFLQLQEIQAITRLLNVCIGACLFYYNLFFNILSVLVGAKNRLRRRSSTLALVNKPSTPVPCVVYTGSPRYHSYGVAERTVNHSCSPRLLLVETRPRQVLREIGTRYPIIS